MGTFQRASALATTIKQACKPYDTEEVGVVLSSLLVDFAKFLGMPKDVFLTMLDGLWDNGYDEDDDEDEDENKDNITTH
jgi:hypothetical protein